MGGELGKPSDINQSYGKEKMIFPELRFDFNASQTWQYRAERAAHKVQTRVRVVFCFLIDRSAIPSSCPD